MTKKCFLWCVLDCIPVQGITVNANTLINIQTCISDCLFVELLDFKQYPKKS